MFSLRPRNKTLSPVLTMKEGEERFEQRLIITSGLNILNLHIEGRRSAEEKSSAPPSSEEAQRGKSLQSS